MTVNIDKYGWPVYKNMDQRHELLKEYIVDSAASGTVYTCFDETSTAPRIIWREVTAGGVKTTTFTYAAWSDRATATYAPINGTLSVDI